MRHALFFNAAALSTTALAGPLSRRGDVSWPHWGYGHGGGHHNEGQDFQDFTPNLEDGFPNPSADQIRDISERAHGTLPNTPLPSGLSEASIANFKLIAFNEIFEVAYFYELVQNITDNVEGYNLGEGREKVLSDLSVILAVEELHAIGANAILQTNNVDPIKPCKYNFPVSDYKSAIALAATFTDLVLGTLQAANDVFAQNTESGSVRLLSSVIGNEAEQEGLFRIIQKKTTPAQPFLTTSTGDFAFTAIQGFVVPGSCPNIKEIPLQTFKPLNVLTADIKEKTQDLKFSFSTADIDVDVKDLSLVLINGQNSPIVEKLDHVDVDGDEVTFTAKFPFNESLLYGLTIAAVTKGSGPFADAGAVSKATVFGPGLIEVN